MVFRWDGIITIAVLLFIAFFIYTKVKKQNMRESFEEIKELVAPRDKVPGL